MPHRTRTRRTRRLRPLLALALLLALLVTALGPPSPVGATTLTVTNGDDSGEGSLRATIAAASAGDTIVFAPDVAEVVLTRQALTLGKNITIQGRGTGGVTVRRSAAGGTPEFRPFMIVNSAVVATLQGLTISGGHTPAGAAGGGIYTFEGTLALLDCVVSGNTTQSFSDTGGEGGGIYQDGGTLTLTNTAISNNSADGAGGGLYLAGGTLTLTNSTVSGNTTTFSSGGGGIYQASGTLTLTGSTVSGNNASEGNGGGLRVAGGTATLTNSTVADNTADEGQSLNGGGTGGGLYLSGTGQVTLTNSTVSGNDADSLYTGGGGLYVKDGTLAVIGSTISGNSASRDAGGGLFLSGTGQATLTNTTVSGNTALETGGGIINGGGTLALRFVSVTGNQTDGNGGGLASFVGTTTLTGSIVAGNTAVGAGPDCAGTPTSGGYNVVGSGGGCPTTGTNDLAYAGTLSALLDPALADNGGPTRTHALPPGSPALNRVPANRCSAAGAADQRGVPRPQGAGCDSGAVERAVALLTVVVDGGLGVGLNPAGSGGGPFGYAPGTAVTLTPLPNSGQTFTGWVVDGVARGWAPSLTITMDANHTVQATFAATKTFGDTGSGRDDYAAVVALATRGYILGLNAQQYGPDQGVQRAQMAALITRATPAGPDTAPTVLAPPACIVAGTWDCDVWPNNFTDRNGLDGNLWRNIGALQHYGVTVGYTAQDCASAGQTFPCFGPTNPVTYAETITFITRAMVAKGYWAMQPNAPQPHAGVPTVFAPFVATFQFYTAGAGGVPAPPTNWSAGATRGWFARALWAALDRYWGTDGPLPDGRNAGGFTP